MQKGIVNLEKHIENIQKYDVPVIVTLNSFVTDTDAENEYIRRFCEERGCEFALSEVWEKGGEGGIALAEKVLEYIGEQRKSISIRCMRTVCLCRKRSRLSLKKSMEQEV